MTEVLQWEGFEQRWLTEKEANDNQADFFFKKSFNSSSSPQAQTAETVMADTGGHVVQLHLTLCASATYSTSQKKGITGQLQKAYMPKHRVGIWSEGDKHKPAVLQYSFTTNVLQPNPLMDLKMQPEWGNAWMGLAIFFSFFGLKCNERSGIWPSVNKAFHSLGYFLLFFLLFSVFRTQIHSWAHMLRFNMGGRMEGGRWMYSTLSVNHPVAAFSLPPIQSVLTLVQVNAGQLNNTHALCEYLKLYWQVMYLNKWHINLCILCINMVEI